MTKATSTSQGSLSSVLADALAQTIGVNTNVSEKFVKPVARQSAAKAYTSRLRKAASPVWGQAASTLSVDIGSDNVLKVNISGTPDEVLMAESLEYGTPDSPPRAIARISEAELTEEYGVYSRRYGL